MDNSHSRALWWVVWSFGAHCLPCFSVPFSVQSCFIFFPFTGVDSLIKILHSNYLRTITGIPILWPWTLNSLIFCIQLDLGKWSHKQDVRERARRKEKSGYLLPHSLLLCYGSGLHCASLRLQLQLCGCPSMISLLISSDTLPLPFLVSLRASILVRKDEFAAVKNLLPNLSDLQLQWLIIVNYWLWCCFLMFTLGFRWWRSTNWL